MTTHTILQQHTVADTATDWSQTISFDQFNPGHGTLQSVDVGLTADLTGSVSVESLEAAPSSVLIVQSGNVSVSDTTAGQLADATPSASTVAYLAAYDGTTNYAGASGTIVPLSNIQTVSTTLQAGSVGLSGFIGTGTVPLTAAATTVLDVLGPANMQIQSQASASAAVELVYNYTTTTAGNSGYSGGEGVETTGVTVSLTPTFANAVTAAPQTLTVADSTTGSSERLIINQFNPALGTLVGIDVTLSSSLSSSVAAENEDTTSAVVTVTQVATETLALPGATEATSGDIVSSAALGAYDGTANFAGTSGTIIPGQTPLPKITDLLTDATDLAAFTGTGTVAASIGSSGTASLEGPGNLLARLTAETGATVTVSYEYVPAGVSTDAIGWDNASGGAWINGTDWSSYYNPPTSSDDVAITQAGTYTVTLSAEETIHSIVIDAPGATLLLDGNLTATDNFTLDAGTIEVNGGTISAADITMNGGLITGDVVDLNSAGTIAVNGGTITADALNLTTGDLYVGGTISATGGTLDATDLVVWSSLETLSVSDSVFGLGAIDVDLLVSGVADTVAGGSSESTIELSSQARDAVVFGGAGNVNLWDAGSNDILIGASGTTSVMLTGSNAAFYGGAGAVTLFDSGHNDTLLGGSSQSTFQLTSGASDELVFGGASSVAMSDAGSHDTLNGSAGPTAVTLSGSDATFFVGSGGASVLDEGQNDTIAGSGAATAITASGSGLVVLGGTGPLSFIGGAGGATIHAGSGAASVTGGSGGVTLYGAAGGAIDYSGTTGDLYYGAGSGNETLNASLSTTNDVMLGGPDPAGRDSIVAGSGNDTLMAGAGADTLVGGSGHDVFVFIPANDLAANEVVENFSGNDLVWLAGYGAAAATAALGTATSSDGSTTITLSDNATITFTGMASASGLIDHIIAT